MDRNLLISEITAACCEVNPEIKTRGWIKGAHFNGIFYAWHPISLADVIYIIRQLPDAINHFECLRANTTKTHPLFREGAIVKMWNLLKDSLSEQETETLEFIHSLLPKT